MSEYAIIFIDRDGGEHCQHEVDPAEMWPWDWEQECQEAWELGYTAQLVNLTTGCVEREGW